jgi:hypothetical protein
MRGAVHSTQSAAHTCNIVHTHACTHGKHHQRTKARTRTLCPLEPCAYIRLAAPACAHRACMHDRSTRSRLSVWMEASVLSSFRNPTPAGSPGWAYNNATCPSPLSPLGPDAPPPPPPWAARWVLTSRDACGRGCGADVASAAARLSGVCARLQGGRRATCIHAQDVPQRTCATAVSSSSSIDPRHIRRCAQQRSSGWPPSCAAHFWPALAHVRVLLLSSLCPSSPSAFPIGRSICCV